MVNSFLSLYSVGGGADNKSASIYTISRSWNANEVTWMNANSNNEWMNYGGDYNVTPLATVPFVENGNWETYNVTTAIREFIENPGSNHGFIIVNNDTCLDRVYAASENGTDSLGPKLTITSSTGIINLATIKIIDNNITVTITSERVRLFIPFNKNYKVSILDIKGRLLISFSANHAGWHQISSSKLSTGMHIIRIRTEGETAFRKFLFIK